MAHFAKIGKGNKVLAVHKIHNDCAITEKDGQEFLNKLYKTNDIWKQTSYNTMAGIHLLGGTPLRKNFANVGYKYDMYKDAFIPPRPFNSWILNETSCQWEAPVAHPNDDKVYLWNEKNKTWDLTNE
tara:strand:+ start:436 stop:816 length:381 start_codon:yes stop_codon:yes gene_type:complete